MRFAAFWSTLVFLCITLGVSLPAAAATGAYNPKSEVIAQINRIKPLQNPEYDTMEDILGRRVLDRKSKVVGSLKDVVLNNSGNIASLDVDFDRMSLGRPVFVNYSGFNIKPVTNGYAMTFDAKEIEDLYPTLLAQIDTASGDGDDTRSLRSFKGLEVWTETGRRVGTVNDVLFGANGQRAEALYVTLSAGATRGKGVAIPFNQVDFEQAAAQKRVTVPDDTADAMLAFAQSN